MKSRLKTLFWILVFLALAAWFVGSSKAFQSCIDEVQHQKTEQSPKDRLAEFRGILIIGSDCTGEFVHKNSESIIAIFTVILGVATILLWAATKALVAGAGDTAQRQLRAYISVTPKDVLNWRHNKPHQRVGIRFELENHGQTIGFEICHSYSMDVLPADIELPPLLVHQYDQANSLFPRATVPVHIIFERVLTPQEITDIESNAKRFYMWGIMMYRDAFKELRTTRFSFSFGGPDFANFMKKVPGVKWNWAHGPHHNDAT